MKLFSDDEYDSMKEYETHIGCNYHDDDYDSMKEYETHIGGCNYHDESDNYYNNDEGTIKHFQD